MAVFVQVSLIHGITGAIYRQFALIICFVVLISLLNAMTLSLALSAIVIRRLPDGQGKFIFLRIFDSIFDRISKIYLGMVAATFISTMLVPVVYVLLETMRRQFVNVEEEVRNRRMV